MIPPQMPPHAGVGLPDFISAPPKQHPVGEQEDLVGRHLMGHSGPEPVTLLLNPCHRS